MEIPPLLKKESNPITIYRIVIISDNPKKYVKDIRRFSYGKLNIENERSGKQKHRYPLREGYEKGVFLLRYLLYPVSVKKM